MKKLLIFLPLLLISCTILNEVYLPYNLPIFNAENYVALRNNPSSIKYPSVQSAINSGVKACSICIKTNQYTSSSSYKSSHTQYPSSYPSQAAGNQNTTSSLLGSGTVSGVAPVQPTPKPSYSPPSSSYRTSGYGYKSYNYDVSGYNYNGDYVYGEVDVDQSGGDGYVYDENGDEIYIDVDWIGKGELEGYGSDGNYYELEVD